MKNKPVKKTQWEKDGHSVNLSHAPDGITLSKITLDNTVIGKKSLNFNYRYLLPGLDVWKKLTWENVEINSNKIVLSGTLILNEEYRFPLECTIKVVRHRVNACSFSGIEITLGSSKDIPWAGEIEIAMPLADDKWRYFVQDLYTKKKNAEITGTWEGTGGRNAPHYDSWWGERQPFEFIAGKKGVLWGRMDSVFHFSSGAKREKDGAVCLWKFTFDSGSRWKSPAFALLFSRQNLDRTKQETLWGSLFLSESIRFREQSGVKEETPIPTANYPIDGGTGGCGPWDKLKIEGTFEKFADIALPMCRKLNFKRILVGAPWISMRSEGITAKCTNSITYDSRCGTIDFKISPKYGGEKSFRKFCDRAHNLGIEVFVWHPGFHLANHSPHLVRHPEWIVRNNDGSTFTAGVYFHISVISPRIEAQQGFLDNLSRLKKTCRFDGLWLDSFTLSFASLDFARKQGVSGACEAVEMIRRFQEMGLKVINEGYAPFGVRGDGEALSFKGQEGMALDTSLFTYYGNLGKIIHDSSYFRFLANKAPLTVPVKYLPESGMEKISKLNAAYNEVVSLMKEREILEDGRGVLWRTKHPEKKLVLFSFKDFSFTLPWPCNVTSLIEKKQNKNSGRLKTRQEEIYILRK